MPLKKFKTNPPENPNKQTKKGLFLEVWDVRPEINNLVY